jgi:hypothetical protein
MPDARSGSQEAETWILAQAIAAAAQPATEHLATLGGPPARASNGGAGVPPVPVGGLRWSTAVAKGR